MFEIAIDNIEEIAGIKPSVLVANDLVESIAPTKPSGHKLGKLPRLVAVGLVGVSFLTSGFHSGEFSAQQPSDTAGNLTSAEDNNPAVVLNTIMEMGYSEVEAARISTLPASFLRFLLTDRVEFDGASTFEALKESSDIYEDAHLITTPKAGTAYSSSLRIANITGIHVLEPETMYVSNGSSGGTAVLFEFTIEDTPHTVRVTTQYSYFEAVTAVEALSRGINLSEDYSLTLDVRPKELELSGIYIGLCDRQEGQLTVDHAPGKSFSSPVLVLPLGLSDPLKDSHHKPHGNSA